MTKYVQEKVERLEHPITAWALFALACVLVGVYAYFVAGAIGNAVEARDMRAIASQIASSVSVLESKYIAVKSSIDLEQARSLGFAEPVSDAIYISRSASVAALSLNR